MNNDHYITRDERGYHCYIRGQFHATWTSYESAEKDMDEHGYVYSTSSASDSGKPFWWYKLDVGH